MSYDHHSLVVEALEGWSLALLSAVRLYWLFALGWYLMTMDPWEGAVVLFPSLLALAGNQGLIWRARWHVRQMRAYVDNLKVR